MTALAKSVEKRAGLRAKMTRILQKKQLFCAF
jgi:hypothetical protein